MNQNNCQCHKSPCICGTGLCNNKIFKDATIGKNTDDDDGNVHHVESIYQRISLKDFENIESCCVPKEGEETTITSFNNSESVGDSISMQVNEKEKEIEKNIDCNECCKHIYEKSTNSNDCKNNCNISTELYCQIKRQTAEPGETISICSISSSESEDSDGSDDIGERSAEFVSAVGRTNDNSEETIENDDEDSFNLPSSLHNMNIEDTDYREHCQNLSCCPINQKCKYIKVKDDDKDKWVKNQNMIEASKQQSNLDKTIEGQVKSKENIKDQDTSYQETWKTIELKPQQHKPEGIIKENSQKHVAISDVKLTTSYTYFPESSYSNFISNTQHEKHGEESVKFDSQDSRTLQTYADDMDRFKNDSKSHKHVFLKENDQKRLSSDSQYNQIYRKRKYDSLDDSLQDEYDSFANFDQLRRSRKSLSGRRRRITLSNFVQEDELSEDSKQSISSAQKITSPLKLVVPDSTYFAVDNTLPTSKPLWDTYVPNERSDFNLKTSEPYSKKPHTTNIKDSTKQSSNINRMNDPQQSFIKQKIKNFIPNKFLCFKYVPKVSPKTSVTSYVPNNSFEQICIDPPEPISIPIPKPKPIPTEKPSVEQPTKSQPSKIPVLKFKEKIEERYSIESQGPSEFSSVEKSEASYNPRRITFGVDDIRNVLVQKNRVIRRSITPVDRVSLAHRRKSTMKSDSLKKIYMEETTSPRHSEDISALPKQMRTRIRTNSMETQGSDSSLRNKMKKYYTDSDETINFEEKPKIVKISEEKKSNIDDGVKSKKKKKPKNKITLSPATSDRSFRNSNALQKTCCSQTEIHVCIKESLISEKSKDESNIVQLVNIEVTPKNSNIVKVNVMPTVPEINNQGVITIPVQLHLYSEQCQNEEPLCKLITKSDSKKDLLYQEMPECECCENYMKNFFSEDEEEEEGEKIPSEIIEKEEEPQLELFNQIPSPSTSNVEVNITTTKYDNIEIQTDLALGQKLLSKSLSSFSSNDSSSSAKNKSEPVKKCGINWNDILLPPPGTFEIKKMPKKKGKTRNSRDNNHLKDNNVPSTSEGLPPTEEVRKKTGSTDRIQEKNKYICCYPHGKSQDEPYTLANEKPIEETKEEVLIQEKPICSRSKIISLVFSESFCKNETYTNPLYQTQFEEDKSILPCTSKPELPWTNILLPRKPQIRKIEKLDISQTSTSITDQIETSTEDYNSLPSPKTTDTCPNLSEVSTHTCECDRYFNDKGTNTSIVDEMEETTSFSINPYTNNSNNNATSNSTEILKSFKEDPVLSAFKAFEEELKPVRKVLAEVQSKLRALNIPELECIFKKDPISEYILSRSASQIAGDWRQTTTTHGCKWPSDCRNPTPSTRKPSYHNYHSRNFRQMPSEVLDYNQRPPSEYMVYRYATSPIPVRSRTLSTHIWKAFGSCERNTIKGPNEKRWISSHYNNMHNTESCDYLPYASTQYESRNTTPDSDFQQKSYDPVDDYRYSEKHNEPIYRYNHQHFSNPCHTNIKIVNDDDDYQSYYRYPSNTYSQHDYYSDSVHSLHSNLTEQLNRNRVGLRKGPPEYSSSFHVPLCKSNNRYIPIEIKRYNNSPEDEGPDLHNYVHGSTKKTSINVKNGIVYARTKIELPKVVYKRDSNIQKNIKKNYPQQNERNYCSQSDYDCFKYNKHSNNCTHNYPAVDDNIPSYYKDYLKNERYL